MAKGMTNGEIIYTICMNHLKMVEDQQTALQFEALKAEHGYDFSLWSREDRETLAGVAVDIASRLTPIIMFVMLEDKIATVESILEKMGTGKIHDDKGKASDEIEQLRRMFGDTKPGSC